jgi:hypothetical protein
MKEQTRSHLVYLWYAFFLAAFYTFVYGYQFNSGDQAEHLPQIYQRFDPSLYTGDFFLTEYYKTFPVRFFYVEIVYWIAHLTPVAVTCFILHILCLAFSVYAWCQVAFKLTSNRIVPFVSTFLMVIVLNRVTVGGNTFANTSFLASNPALTLVSFGFLFFLRKQYVVAGVVLGLATLFQPLFGMQFWIICSVLLVLFFDRESWSGCLKMGISYLACAAPMLVPVLLAQSASHVPEGFTMQEFYKLLYIQRCFLHFMPSLFPVGDYLLLGTLVALAAWCAYRIRPGYTRVLFRTGLIIVVGCHLYWLCLEVMQVGAAGKLQWFKTTVWLNAISCIPVADFLCRRIRFVLNEKLLGQAFQASAVLLLFVINNAAWLPLERLKHRYKTGNYAPTDLELTHEWIRNNTPKDAMFLCAPGNDAFNCEAQRPTPVNYKALVFEPFYFAAWKKRMEDYYAVDFSALGRSPAIEVARMNYDSIVSYPSPNPVLYRLDQKSTSHVTGKLGPVVFEKGDWIVTRIP